MTYEEEKRLYDKIMDSISRAFIYGDNLDELLECKKIYDSHTWSSLHDGMIQPFLNTRIQVVRKLQNKDMVKISNHVFTETNGFIKNHMN
jgi:hypothetical protein